VVVDSVVKEESQNVWPLNTLMTFKCGADTNDPTLLPRPVVILIQCTCITPRFRTFDIYNTSS